jgi:hypothetical protein
MLAFELRHNKTNLIVLNFFAPHLSSFWQKKKTTFEKRRRVVFECSLLRCRFDLRKALRGREKGDDQSSGDDINPSGCQTYCSSLIKVQSVLESCEGREGTHVHSHGTVNEEERSHQIQMNTSPHQEQPANKETKHTHLIPLHLPFIGSSLQWNHSTRPVDSWWSNLFRFGGELVG